MRLKTFDGAKIEKLLQSDSLDVKVLIHRN